MQQQNICPRCKFRLTTVKAICPTCGFALQSARRPVESTPSAAPSRPVHHHQAASSSSTAAASVRKVQASAPSGGGGSFWRTFFGLDPLPADSSDRDEHALGET